MLRAFFIMWNKESRFPGFRKLAEEFRLKSENASISRIIARVFPLIVKYPLNIVTY